MSLAPKHEHQDHQINCHRCGGAIEEWCETRRYGFWDEEKQAYESHGGIEEKYCRDCWDKSMGRTNGAHLRPQSAEQLFAILDAADGDLAAIPTWWSKRPAIRVVDGELEGVVTKPRRDGFNSDGEPIIKFEAELIEEFDREEFDDVAEPGDEMNLVLLREPSMTPFAEIHDLSENGDGPDGDENAN